MDNNVSIFCTSKDKVNIDKDMAFRFLRLRRKPDEECERVFDSCYNEFLDAVSYKACYRYFDICIQGDDVRFGDLFTITSHSLSTHLDTCKGAFVFVATCGGLVDRLINKHSQLRVSYAVIMDAIGSSAIEGFCDLLCDKLCSDYDIKLKSRFSPGYGDLNILNQTKVLMCCDSSRKIGVTLTDNHMMVPTKSVSAIVGVE